MDLSMILSPDVEDQSSSVLQATSIQDNRIENTIQTDDLKNAVAILHDFQGVSTQNLSTTRNLYEETQRNPFYKMKSSSYQYPVSKIPENRVKDVDSKSYVKHQKLQSPTIPSPKASIQCKFDLLLQADSMLTQEIKTSTICRVNKVKFLNSSPETSNSCFNSLQTTSSLRSGAWTKAEEEYTAALIYHFVKGTLGLPRKDEGITLRKYLAGKLQCNRRRVSMKLATETIANRKIPRKVGASVFATSKRLPTMEEQELIAKNLEELRERCFNSAASPGQDNRNRQYRTRDLLPQLLTQDSPLANPLLSPALSNTLNINEDGKKLSSKRPKIIRTGFDSPEEEAYTTAMFRAFCQGYLNLTDGMKLVSYLCRELDCSPKILSMKLAPRRLGDRNFPDNVGSILYKRKINLNTDERVLQTEKHLKTLRLAYHAKVNEQSNESALSSLNTDNTDEVMDSRDEVESIKSPTSLHSPLSVEGNECVNGTNLFFSRSGQWSKEEEIFTATLIDCFFKGALKIPEGTTLRAFLASRLCCNRMRISKKLASERLADFTIPKKIGSAAFVKRSGVTDEEQQETEDYLQQLQKDYFETERLAAGKSLSVDESLVMYGLNGTNSSQRTKRSHSASFGKDDGEHERLNSPKRPNKTIATKIPRSPTDVYTPVVSASDTNRQSQLKSSLLVKFEHASTLPVSQVLGYRK